VAQFGLFDPGNFFREHTMSVKSNCFHFRLSSAELNWSMIVLLSTMEDLLISFY
jgi:hypothetical protein